ncbi:MAG TPA: hypothetical protein VNW29_03355 [Candidatus Sulfotelmatobacter sp.]|jgi:hypothetical protein|nr:hypothetical protein [Candidatus Sulfotelmatobacter sp.]
MSKQIFSEVLPVDWSANGAQILNSTAEALIFPDFTIPAFYMNDGKFLRYTAWGSLSNVVTTPGTLQFTLRMGGLAGTMIAQTAAISLNIVAQTNIIWNLVCDIVSRGNGTASPILAIGNVILAAQLAANNNQPNFMSAGGASAPATVNIDTTQNQALSLTGKFSVSTATTQLTGFTRTIESLT